MTIERTISKVKYNFKLTPDELYEAYVEQQHLFDVESVISYGETFETIEEDLGCTYSEYLSMKEEIADELRSNIDNHEMSFDYALSEAVDTVISRNKELIV